jgi:hypothetical protein
VLAPWTTLCDAADAASENPGCAAPIKADTSERIVGSVA